MRNIDVPIQLGSLLIGEEFTTSCLGHPGRVLGWGSVQHVEHAGMRRVVTNLPCVEAVVDGHAKQLSPELLVLVPATRSHTRIADLDPDRFDCPLALDRDALLESLGW